MNSINIDGQIKWKTCVLIGVTIFLTHLLNWWFGRTLDLTTFGGKQFLLIELGLFLHKCFGWDFTSFCKWKGNIACKIHSLHFMSWRRKCFGFVISFFINVLNFTNMPSFSIPVSYFHCMLIYWLYEVIGIGAEAVVAFHHNI